MRKSSTMARAAVAVGVVLAAATVVQAQELEKLNILVPNERTAVQYQVFVAKDLGFYADEGLDVTFLSSATAVPYVAFLQNGDADVIMLDAPETMQAANAGVPISVIYEVNQIAPEGIVVAADSDITDLAGLRGKTIGLASDRDLATTTIAFQKAGLSIDEATTVVVGDAGPIIVSSFRNGQVQAFAGGTSDRFAMESAGIPFRDITPAAAQRNPANSFIIRPDRKEELRDRVQRFLRAWSKAQQAGMVDFDAIAAICKVNVPEQWERPEVGRKLLDFSVYKLNVPRTRLRGELQPYLWAEVQPPMVELGVIDKEIDPSSFLDSSFIDAANDYENAEVAGESGEAIKRR